MVILLVRWVVAWLRWLGPLVGLVGIWFGPLVRLVGINGWFSQSHGWFGWFGTVWLLSLVGWSVDEKSTTRVRRSQVRLAVPRKEKNTRYKNACFVWQARLISASIEGKVRRIHCSAGNGAVYPAARRAWHAPVFCAQTLSALRTPTQLFAS